MRSVRNAYYFPGYLTGPRVGSKVGVAGRRPATSPEGSRANLGRTASEPHHMFGLMVMLLGLQLMGPALLTSTGYFNRVLAMFPAALPHVLAALAFAGGLAVVAGIVLFVDGLRRKASS